VLTGGIAEIERQMSTDLAGNQRTWDERPRSAARKLVSSGKVGSFRIDFLSHRTLLLSNRLDSQYERIDAPEILTLLFSRRSAGAE
jgi:hypothetical protein